jgi:hypothetical protein
MQLLLASAAQDDVLMCLAELQLQQEGKGSCASALEKASTCMHQLQDSLSVGSTVASTSLLWLAQALASTSLLWR